MKVRAPCQKGDFEKGLTCQEMLGKKFLNGEQGRGEPLLQAQGNRCMDLVCLGKQDMPLAKTLLSGVGQWWDLGCMPMHI